MPSGEQFLDNKYQDLRASQPVEHEAKRRKMRGETAQRKPHEKIGDFLDVLKRTHGHHEDPRVLERIKAYYHEQHVIKPEDIPESYYQSQGEMAVREGRADDLERAGITIETITGTNKHGEEIQKRVYDFPQEYKDQLAEVIIKDQQATLDNWVDYLSSPDADAYPMWAKYWAFRSMLGLSTFDKEKHKFNKRRKDTVAPFPDLNREALAYVVDMIAKKVEEKNIQEFAQDDLELQQVLQTENFGKLYAYAIEKVTPAEEAELKDTRGKWITYRQGSDHMPLVESIQGHGTGWCTAGESTAKSQIEHGDFHVFYSLDKDGKPTMPRAAIRMEGKRIAEVRGIAHEQNLDPNITPVVEKKLHDFGEEGGKYQKRSTDMKRLTAIEQAMNEGKPLDESPLFSSEAEALRFLYEIDTKVEGFGYQSDPRINELRNSRDRHADIAVIFDCTPEQVAFDKDGVNEKTKVYVGPIFPGVFSYENIEQVYTKFPEWPRGIYNIRVGDKTPADLKAAADMKSNGGQTAHAMLKSEDFARANTDIHDLDIVIVTPEDLGFTREPREYPSKNEMIQKAAIYGLEPCPITTAPYLVPALQGKKFGDIISVVSDDWIVIEEENEAKSLWPLWPRQFTATGRGITAAGSFTSPPTTRGLSHGNFAFQRKKGGQPTISERSQTRIPEVIEQYFLNALEIKYGRLGKDAKYRVLNWIDILNKTFDSLEDLQSKEIVGRGKRVLDLGCGSVFPSAAQEYVQILQTSEDETEREKARIALSSLGVPTELYYRIEPGKERNRTWEPWLCRILKEFKADPVGIDSGNLEGEQFEHHQRDLTQPGALDFLPDHSFDAINMQGLLDSPSLHLSKARKKQAQEELERQAKRLLKEDGRTILWDVDF